jgi:hypothetical protein
MDGGFFSDSILTEKIILTKIFIYFYGAFIVLDAPV